MGMFSFLTRIIKVNTLIEWIFGIYMHKFTNNEWEISEFTVSELVQVNPGNWITSNECVNIFIIQIEYTAKKLLNFESAEAMV